MSSLLALEMVLALAAGVVLGKTHFAALHRVADQFAEGKALAAAGLQAARLALLAAVLVGAAWFGALPLLACTAGVLVGRWIVLRRARSAP